MSLLGYFPPKLTFIIISQNNCNAGLVHGSFTVLKDLILQANITQLTRKDREMWNITTKALLHLGVILIVDVFFHYLYILTIPSDMKLVGKLSDWCLGERIPDLMCTKLQ